MNTTNLKNKLSVKYVIDGVCLHLKNMYRSLSILPSQYIFGNFAGFWNNLIPRVKIGMYHMKHKGKALKQSVGQEAHKLSEQGFLLIPENYPKDILAKVHSRYNEIINDPEFSKASHTGASRFIYRPLESIPGLDQLLSDDMSEIVSAYYKSPFKVKSVRAWRNLYVKGVDGEKNDVFSNTFHHDGYNVLGLRCFVLLSEKVTKDTGAFRFHDKSVSRKITREIGIYSRGSASKRVLDKLLNPETLRYFEGKLGDACIVNTQECLHAASIPKEGTWRDILQFELEPSDRVLDTPFDNMPLEMEIEKLFGRIPATK